MKTAIRGLSLVAISALAAAPARAEMAASPTAEHWTVGALLGYGFKDGVGFGLGVRGGYTLPMNVYLGGTFMYHFGKSVGPVDVNVFYLGFEGGYDIAAVPAVLPPLSRAG